MIVSVIMITYGHAHYIRQAIEGVLMQQCDFDFELIIADDSSPDETQRIVSEILKVHPNSDKAHYTRHQQNIGMMNNLIWCLQHAKGKYIAICEGDDYWIDAKKLQKQVDFMKNNPDYSICFTDYKVWFQNTEIFEHPGLSEKYKDDSTFLKKDILYDNFIPTLTVLYVNRPEVIPFLHEKLFPADWFLHMLNSRFGKIKFLPHVTAVYRKHDQGACSSSNPIRNNERYLQSIDIFRRIIEYDRLMDFRLRLLKLKIRFQNFKMRTKKILFTDA